MTELALAPSADPVPLPTTHVSADLDGIVAGLASTEASIGLGDAMDSLRQLPDGCVRTTVTSPPYWGLRDCGIDGQIGLEAELDEFIQALVVVFEEVRRVTADDGTLWVNIGDSFTSGGLKWRAPDKKNRHGP